MSPAVDALRFIDNSVPESKAGNYWISVEHDLPSGINTSGRAPSAVQGVTVSAPQFALDPDEIVSRHPAPTASGRFGEQLPHVVLREASLPWERELCADGATPWLALLVLTEDELIGGEGASTRAAVSTIANFLAPEPGVLKPSVTPADDVDTSTPVASIRLTTRTFAAVTPRLAELPYLTHVRQANIADKAAMNLAPSGLSAVVMSNRFPGAPSSGQSASVKNIVHLVSLEGFAGVLSDNADFGGASAVALVSLASWTFECRADRDADFRGLAAGLVGQEMAGGTYEPQRLWLRLGAAALKTDTPAGAEAAMRLEHGYVPLGYRTRAGDDGFAWYRGPLVPVPTSPLARTEPFLTADSALIYQAGHGVFDLSLAAAWETGRAVALADKAFGQRMLDFRRRAHRLTDELLERLQRQYFFSQRQIDDLAIDVSVHDEFLTILNAELMRRIAAVAVHPDRDAPASQRLAAATAAIDPKAAVRQFLTDSAVQARIAELMADDLNGIAQWLARLLLLYPVPFNVLVPDERMLPTESLRCFYLDRNWTRALLDGALSLGLESSRHRVFHAAIHGRLHAAALGAARSIREALTGAKPAGADTDTDTEIISGVLLRSAMVSGWPNLSVRGYAATTGEATLPVLRMDHLSPTVLLCLFRGVPARLELAEPQEGFRLGVDDDGNATLRNVTAAGPGEQIGSPFPVINPTGGKPRFVRAQDCRVLDIAPASPGGLIRSLAGALVAAQGLPASATSLTPAQFALQMVKSPEAIVFASQS